MESFYSWLSSFSEVNFNDVDDEGKMKVDRMNNRRMVFSRRRGFE